MPVRKRSYERDGKRWVRFIATVELGGTDRKRRTKSFEREREAKNWLSRQQAQVDAKQVSGLKTPTVSQLMDSWLEYGKTRARDPWKSSTLMGNESSVRAHIKPKLGHIRIEDLTVFHVEQMLATIPGNRARNVRGALSSALTMAVKQRLIAYNVANSVAIPDAPRSSRGALSVEDARRFLDAVRGHRFGPLLIVTTSLGMRQSEVIGLRWQDVDLDARELRVEQRIYRRYGVYDVGPPKSKASRRTIHFPTEIETVLREHRQTQLVYRMRAREWADNDLVFTSLKGTPLHGPYVTRTFQKLLRQAGIEQHHVFHDLRHTGASLMHAMGVDLKTVQAVLGHSDFRLTADTYTHVDDGVLKDAAGRMGGFLRQREV